MSNVGILLSFGLLVIIAAASLRLYRSRPLSMRLRLVGSIVAVGLFGLHYARSGESLQSAILPVGLMALVLCLGLIYLWFQGKQPPPADSKDFEDNKGV